MIDEQDSTGTQLDWAGFPDGEMTTKFKEFHKDNPHILRHLVRDMLVIKRRGYKRAGIAMFWERMRWRHYITTTDVPFKLNNNHKAFYTRLIDNNEPELKGFITRRSAAADSVKL